MEPTAGMQADAASAGFYTHKLNGLTFPRLQIATVAELLDGRSIGSPSNIAAGDDIFKKAPKVTGPAAAHPELEL